MRAKANEFARIAGFEVNLRQIKACLKQHPGVVRAAVSVVARPADEPRLIGYVVPRTDAAPTEKELRDFLKGKVSDYAVPGHVVSIASIPTDERGIVQTGLLPKPSAPARAPEDAHVPLQGILHQQLIGIWQEILKVPGITIDDNFFALGGSSLLALRMMGEIEKLCGRPLPLSLLLTGATISNLARFIVDTNNESSPPLIAVQPKGTLTPLFFLHGDWAGGGYYCGRFAEELGENQPFFAIPPYRSGKAEVLTVAEMADYHLKAVRKQAPNGPYLLGGYCIGATVAVEMARQLAEEGEEVRHLFLIDPPLWGGEWLRWVWPLVDAYGNSRGWDLSAKIGFYDKYCVSFHRWSRRPAAAKMNSIVRRLGLRGSAAASSSGLPASRDPNAANDEEILTSMDYAVYFLAYRLYRLHHLSVPATLFFPESIRASRLSWILKRSERSPVKFAVRTLPGNHHTCVTKHTSALVERMRETLDAFE